MMRRLVFGLGLLSATMLSHGAFAEGAQTLSIIVSKNQQQMVVYDGDKVVATTRVSTGKPGHGTPSGIFSIIQKEKYHESNIYSNAPMPWMQRITWSGIALHEGVVPNHPASHGCVRMPGAFARSLYQMTENGAHVIIADTSIVPEKIDDALLFAPRKPLPSGPMMTDTELRTSSIKRNAADGSKPVEVAMNVSPDNPVAHGSDAPSATVAPSTGISPDASDASASDIKPTALRILITRRGDRENLMDAQKLLEDMGFETGGQDGYLGPLTRSAITGFKRWKGLSEKGALMSEEFVAALYDAAGKPRPPAGQIMVRRGFQPIFEAAVGIKDPDMALGTHLLTADHVDRDGETAEWHAMTLPNTLSDDTKRRLGITVDNDATGAEAARAAFDRIDVPADIRDRIETMMGDGTSVTINDEGVGPETGQGTDFITVTNDGPQMAQADIENVSDTVSDAPAKPRRLRHAPKLGVGLY